MTSEIEKQVGILEEEEDEYNEDNEMEIKEEDDEDKFEVEFSTGRYLIPPDQLLDATEKSSPASGGRRSRPMEEKERTKLRERHRRAITGRILAGLRRHGNYNLRVRADINEVIAALAREAGWVVMPDGTTFPSSPATPQVVRPAAVSGGSPAVQPSPLPSFKGVSPAGAVRTLDHPSGRLKAVFSPPTTAFEASQCRSSVAALAGLGQAGDKLADDSPIINNNSSATSGENKQMVVATKVEDRCYAGTPYVPVYVMLPLDVINNRGELANPEVLVEQLQALKSINVDGVMIDCWWGIVEAHAPQVYNWEGYKQLFRIVRECKLKIQAVMSFHECGGNVGDDVSIPLPHWVSEIGKINRDIYFTDREGRRNTECLSWGIDKERILRGRTAIEVYFDCMRSFRVEFDDFFEDGVISEVQIGLGPCGELRYPSYPAEHGWRYPGIGEFQCYDSYLLKGLREAAKARGHPHFASGPKNAGSYNSKPHETGFFRDGGDYDSAYGRFFLAWYSRVLIDHGDLVVSLAKLVFGGSRISVKLSGIHWWYKTASHAAELTAGFYNPSNRDGYTPIAAIVKKHDAILNFTCAELLTLDQHEDFPEALADPEGLVWQVLNVAWDANIPMASENALPCYDRDGYNRILESAKPLSNPDRRHLSSFTYLRLSPILMYTHNFIEFERFVQRMHGQWVPITR